MNNKQMKGNMQDKPKKKKEKSEIKVRDLKPGKDPKGGYPPGPPTGPGRSGPRPNVPPGPSLTCGAERRKVVKPQRTPTPN